MSKGYPDYFVNTGAFGQFDTDNLELSARLGALSRFQRSGKVVYFDSLQSVKPVGEITLASANCSIHTTHNGGYEGQSCLKLVSDAVKYNLSNIIRYIPLIYTGKHGLEFIVYIEDDNIEFFVDVKVRIGTDTYTFSIKITLDTNVLYYQNNGGSYVAVDDNFSWVTAPLNWSYVKMIFDVSNVKFSELYFNNNVYTIDSSVPVASGGANNWHTLSVDFKYQVNTTAASFVKLANLVYTIDEP